MDPKYKSYSSDSIALKERKAITIEVKLEITKRFKNGETATNIDQLLDLSHSIVVTILKDQEHIIKHVK